MTITVYDDPEPYRLMKSRDELIRACSAALTLLCTTAVPDPDVEIVKTQLRDALTTAKGEVA